jgi:hypothetical protein
VSTFSKTWLRGDRDPRGQGSEGPVDLVLRIDDRIRGPIIAPERGCLDLEHGRYRLRRHGRPAGLLLGGDRFTLSGDDIGLADRVEVDSSTGCRPW